MDDIISSLAEIAEQYSEREGNKNVVILLSTSFYRAVFAAAHATSIMPIRGAWGWTQLLINGIRTEVWRGLDSLES